MDNRVFMPRGGSVPRFDRRKATMVRMASSSVRMFLIGIWFNEPCFEPQLRKTDLQSFPMY